MSRKRYEIVATCFDRKGRVISSAMNDYRKSHPLMKHFSILAGESEHKHAIHAELGACLAARGKEIDSILVQRYDAYGNQSLAKPCKACQEMLKSFGVKTVRYTSKEGIKEYAN